MYAWTAAACARGWAHEPVVGVTATSAGIAAITAVAAAVALALLVAARRDLRAAPPEDDPGAEARRFVSSYAAWVAGFSLLAILWTGLPAAAVMPPCGS